jgi:hypothetical protein
LPPKDPFMRLYTALAAAGSLTGFLVATFAAAPALAQDERYQNPFEELREERKPDPVPRAPAFTVPADVETAPIRLAKVSARLRTGQEVARFPLGFLNGCRWTDARLDWPGGRGMPAFEEMEQVFADEFQAMGYEAVSTAYGFVERDPRVDYDVAAVVTALDLELCDFVGVLGVEPPGRYKGQGTATIDWEVRDRLTRQVVLRLQTTGFGRVENATSEIIVALLARIFADGAARLGAKPDTLALLRLDGAGDAPALAAAAPTGPALPISGPPAHARSEPGRMAEAQNATATIVRGDGHGSGFFISTDGYMLTNQHVVGNQAEVRVRLNNGVELIGEVVRRDEARDVALVKLPIPRAPALPIDTQVPAVGADVFAVGAPLRERLEGTVSRGVVSALRPATRREPALIQSDVDIHGGNSGGPLLDARGNVVGISVSGFGLAGVSVGLNFFIPVGEALAVLNLELAAGS